MEIRRESFASETARALTEALEEELLVKYDGVPGSGGLRAPSVFAPPEGVFLVGWVDGERNLRRHRPLRRDDRGGSPHVRRPGRASVGGSPAGCSVRLRPKP